MNPVRRIRSPVLSTVEGAATIRRNPLVGTARPELSGTASRIMTDEAMRCSFPNHGASLQGASPFFAKPDGTSKSPSGAKNWRRPCLRRPAFVLRPPRRGLRYAPPRGMASANDWTPCRLPYVLSPPALSAQTPTKHPALGLRGGRRTRSLRSTSVCSFSDWNCARGLSTAPWRPIIFWSGCCRGCGSWSL